MKLLPDSKFPNNGLICLVKLFKPASYKHCFSYLPISLSNLLQPDLFIESTHLNASQRSFFSLWESNITKQHFTKIRLSSQNDLGGGGNVSCRRIN